jgi:hypothetical protein
MNSPMDRFLQHIHARRARIRNTISKLEDELQKLEYSEQVYRASGALSEGSGRKKPIVVNATAEPDEHSSHKLTIKDRITTMLLVHPEGLTSSRLLECLRAEGSLKMRREILAPCLSRLKAEKTLELEHGLWRLKGPETNVAYTVGNTSYAEKISRTHGPDGATETKR